MTINSFYYEDGDWKNLLIPDIKKAIKDGLENFNATISPDGIWYQVGEGEHFEFALEYLKDEYN